VNEEHAKSEKGCLRLLIEKEDICPSLEESVCGRETCETTTDDDDLCHE
jgi:hypothetical protein